MARALLILLTVGGCRSCTGGVTALGPAEVRVDSTIVTFPPTYVGQTSSASLGLSNSGGQPTTLSWAVAAPFDVTPRALTIAARDSMALELRFSPLTVGPFETVLAAGSIDLTLELGMPAPTHPETKPHFTARA